MQYMELGAVMRRFMTAPMRAGRHVAIWLVWQSTGITLVDCD
jgi:hypothetical protein